MEHEFGKGRRWIEKWKEMKEWRRKDWVDLGEDLKLEFLFPPLSII